MLRLTRIDEGACYITDTAKQYVAWSMLCLSSKLFWGCGIIKDLDRVKSLLDKMKYVSGQDIGDKSEALSELLELLQNNESSVLDAVRIMICFENYFKAKMLLSGYIIHEIDPNECENRYPEFYEKNKKKVPILIRDIKQAENLDNWGITPLQTLKKQTIRMSMLLREPKYRKIYSGQTSDDQRLFYLLRKLNETRNTLHLLSVEYIVGEFEGFVFLRDYVTNHIDVLANKMADENKGELDAGKSEINHLIDIEYDNLGEEVT